uniref:Uncharacterized protein n=1 Tax=Plectus sambesii TaxID=2011161 RepID=A0A914UHQ9_9BILA
MHIDNDIRWINCNCDSYRNFDSYRNCDKHGNRDSYYDRHCDCDKHCNCDSYRNCDGYLYNIYNRKHNNTIVNSSFGTRSSAGPANRSRGSAPTTYSPLHEGSRCQQRSIRGREFDIARGLPIIVHRSRRSAIFSRLRERKDDGELE